jgi:hypothetical protein
MKKFLKISFGFVYFFLVSVPLAITIYSVLCIVIFIKLIYNQIKSVCKKISMK